MWRSRRAEVTKKTKKFAYAMGVANLIILIFGASTALTLSVAIVLAPFLLATGLQLTASIACGALSYALSDRRDRAELLARVIATMLPWRAGEQYQEAMIAEIRAAPPHLVRPIALNLVATAPRTILEVWVLLPMPLGKRRR